MELHDVVPGLIAVVPHRRDDRVDIVDSEADVVQADFIQITYVGIRDCSRLPVVKELDFGSRCDPFRYERDMICDDVAYTHIGDHRRTRDDNADCFAEAQQAEEPLCIREVADKIWLVSFMNYDLGFFDQECGRVTSAENPFGAKYALASDL